MKRDWRKPRPSAWLLLRPGLHDDAWDWLRVEAGEVLASGQGQPPAAGSACVVLVIPALACSRFRQQAPAKLKAQAWPTLLEEQLLQADDQVHCACLARRGSELQLLVVERALLQRWQARCADWGLTPAGCWAEFQLLPEPLPGHAWHWHREDGADLLRGQDLQGQEHWLAWPTGLASVPPAPWPTLQARSIDGLWPRPLARLEQLPLLFQPRRARARRGVRLAPGQWPMVAACLALVLLWGAIWGVQQWRQVQLYQAQVAAVTGKQDSARQATLTLRRLQAELDERQVRLRRLEGLQDELRQWLDQHADWHLRAARFDGRSWHLSLEGQGQAPDWQAMASRVGALHQVRAQATTGPWQVSFDLEGA
ncbi:type II secretion system protein GspL [Pseudomonas fulva]|nr:type II secretion system protein GspL [Pseudomonas fulva]MBF8779866.1 type II secretion system protein GspL [Pseudomonas fulva]